MIELAAHENGTIVPVRAQPGARTNAILGERAGALRVAVAAAPERGKANEAIRDVLAEALGCRPSQIVLLSGETSRTKRFLITGVTREELQRRIACLGDPGWTTAATATPADQLAERDAKPKGRRDVRNS